MKPRILYSFVLLLTLNGMGRADALDKAASSLAWTPAEVSHYSAWLRNAEQLDAIAKSKAWKKVVELPYVQEAWKTLKTLPDSPFAKLDEKPVKEVLSLLGEMTADEVCILAGDNYGDFVLLMAELQGAINGGRLVNQFQGGGGDSALASARMMLQVLKESRDKIKAPDILVGFRLKDAARAKAVAKKLEGWFGDLVEETEALKGKLKKAKVGEIEWISLTLDGSMVPWDKIPWNAIEDQEGEYVPLVKKLKETKLTTAVGTRGEYVLVSLGETTGLANKLGKGKLLVEVAEMKPLAKFADKKIDSISYTSKALATKTATTKEDIDGTIEFALQMLKSLPLTDEDLKKINKDIKQLAKEMKANLPTPGATLSFSFETERGGESYAYDWTVYPSTPEPKPLSILQHLGGNPIAAYVTRNPSRLEDYKNTVKWVRLADGYLDSLVLPKLPEDQQKPIEAALGVIRPFAKKWDDITAKKTLPALKDGQFALVLDGRLKSNQWIRLLPKTEKELPLPELTFVLGVSDAALLQKAPGEYRVLFNDTVKLAAQMFGAPAIEIPEAKQTKGKEHTLYSYVIADLIGLDPQIELAAAISSKVAAFGITAKTVERLVAPTDLKVGGPLAKLDRPLLSADYFNAEAFVKMMEPYANLVTDMLLDQYVDEDEKEKRASIRLHVKTVLEVLSVFKSSTGVTYVEGKAHVTHTETVYRDLEK